MSRRNVTIIGILVLMGITSVVSILAYTFIIGGDGTASQPISAPTLSLEDPTNDPSVAQVEALSTQVAELQAQNATLVAEVANAGAAALSPTAEATVEAASVSTEVTDEATVEATVETAAVATDPTLFRIVPEESEVRFIITEDLRGQPTTPIGITNQVAGDIVVDFSTPANSRVGTIRINARTLTTDSEFRNRAIRAEILESSKDEYEFIDFTPTAISGLPASVAVGEEVTFQITGDLKIRDIVNAVTFDVTATVVSEDRLEGTASTQVTRAAYDLQIPNAPGVANVSDEVTLEIDFVAAKVTE
jgi:polyisoprenoid-binding protein YceI